MKNKPAYGESDCMRERFALAVREAPCGKPRMLSAG